jgi:hypothetical protein
MFAKTFTVTVTTDAQGRFHSSLPVTSPFSMDVKITATFRSPAGGAVHASFGLSPSGASVANSPHQFVANTGETVDLGKWKVIAGDDANVATATGYTEPPAANTELSVEFVAAPSFF